MTQSLKKVIPWAFAYDRYNLYSRYSLPYLSVNLLSQHPEIYKFFMNDNFSVQISENDSFGRNDTDKTIENTINKEMKTPDGVREFSFKVVRNKNRIFFSSLFDRVL